MKKYQIKESTEKVYNKNLLNLTSTNGKLLQKAPNSSTFMDYTNIK